MRPWTACLSYGLLCVAGSAPPTDAAAADADTGPAPNNPATAQELQQVVVIGNAPLPGLGLPLNQIPANVQTANSEDMRRQQTLDLADYLNNNFSGINVSESADNPFQLDINYHGFTASPLLGTPEGLSVYVDGVRVNESFGDTVNWDLIPESAMSTVTLMSGSNPVFGLNTLGGALSVHTKSGHENPGTEFEGYAGSFGRRSFQGESGGEAGPFDYFLTGEYFDEKGWRDGSHTEVYQGFGKVGWQNEKTDIDLSYTYADTSLYGNGAVPRACSISGAKRAIRRISPIICWVSRTSRARNSSPIICSCPAISTFVTSSPAAATATSTTTISRTITPDPPIDCAAPPASGAELSYCANGQTAVSRLIQHTAGFGVQLTDSEDLFGMKNQAIVGADYEDSRDSFEQMFRYGALAADRTLIEEVTALNDQTVISLKGSNKILGAYLTDTLTPSRLFHITASMRYNRNTETLDGFSVDTDVGDVGSGFGAASPLAAEHTFSSVNPAVGLTMTPTDALTFYANYNVASRAPTVIELGCSNPAAPCGLPNDFASDPDLKQVVARTAEVGVRRSTPDQRWVWSADLFRTVNSDDIQFVAASTNQGYFDNVGTTRREGLDLAMGGRQGGLTWHLTYSYVDATYQSTFAVNAGSNSTADADGNILVHPGDRIPLIPRHTGRLVLDYEFNPRWNVGANMALVSGSFLHGNENNANQAGSANGQGAFIAGSGWIPGYTVVNLHGTCHVTKNVEAFARLVNLFDKEYSTAGFLTANSFNPNGSFRFDPNAWTNENAVSPAQPRAIWAGVRIRVH